MKRIELAAIGVSSALVGVGSLLVNTPTKAAAGAVVMAVSAIAIVTLAERRGWVPEL